jgi:hypothetical protein
MSDLTFIERKQLEKLYGMSSGYVLDFSDRTFQEFVFESTKLDILSEQFKKASGSKANRLRAFWQTQPNRLAGKLILDLCEYHQTLNSAHDNKELLNICVRIGHRLFDGTTHKKPPANDVSSSQKSPYNRAQLRPQKSLSAGSLTCCLNSSKKWLHQTVPSGEAIFSKI